MTSRKFIAVCNILLLCIVVNGMKASDNELLHRKGAELCPKSSHYFYPENVCVLKESQWTTWIEAQRRCQEDKTDLVHIASKEKNDWVFDTFKFHNNTLPAWIGLIVDETHSHSWLNGAPFNWTGFQAWASDVTPQSVGCVYYSTNRTWGIQGCSNNRLSPLCELRDVDKCRNHNGGCQQICVHEKFMSKKECQCDEGYVLQKNGSCKDVNECETDNGGCSQQCTNVDGGWMCDCQHGYEIQGVDCLKQDTTKKVFKMIGLVLLVLSIAVVPLTIAVQSVISTWATIRRTLSLRRSSTFSRGSRKSFNVSATLLKRYSVGENEPGLF